MIFFCKQKEEVLASILNDHSFKGDIYRAENRVFQFKKPGWDPIIVGITAPICSTWVRLADKLRTIEAPTFPAKPQTASR